MNKNEIEIIGDDHIATSTKTPLRENAFDQTEYEKIEKIIPDEFDLIYLDSWHEPNHVEKIIYHYYPKIKKNTIDKRNYIKIENEITIPCKTMNGDDAQQIINNSDESGFIPCYPSSLSSNYDNIPYKLIDELGENDYNDFNNTKILLEKIYRSATIVSNHPYHRA